MLSLEHVYAGYHGHDIIKNISFTLPSNENLCILGPNGCGKTTLLRAIGRLIPSKGMIKIDGVDINSLRRNELALKLAVMSQISTIYFPYTIYETVLLGRYQYMKSSIFSTPSKKDKEIVEQCMETTGLSDIRNRALNTLSGGQLQRVFLAHTLVQDPNIILLDEPTNHLDLKHQIELITYLKQWSKQENHAVIGVFHDINLAIQLSKQVLFLKDGVTKGYGTIEDVITPSFLQSIYEIDIAGYMMQSYQIWDMISKKEEKLPD